MKALLLSLTLMIFSANSAEQIKVMCYNIYGARNTDGAKDLNRIIEVIKAKNPDILALQEVDKETSRINKRDIPKELADALKMQHTFRKTIPLGGGEYGLAILSKFPISDVKAVQLPKVGENRIALLATVKTKSSKKLRLLNTHLHHRSGQEKQVKVVEELIKSEKVDLAMGDFNIRHNDEKIQGVYKLMKEAFADAQNFGTIPVKVGAKRNKIDFIFYNPKRLRLRTALMSPDFKKSSQWEEKMAKASDHLALFSEFSLR